MSSRFWTGFIIIIFGIGFLLQQVGIWSFANIFQSGWPLIIVIIGIVQLFNRTTSSTTAGLFCIIIGGIFFVNQWTHVNLIKIIWPLAIIYVGIMIVFSKSNHRNKLDSNHSVDSLALFAEVDIRNESKDFSGGDLKAIFGSGNFDFREIILSGKEATLDVITIFGEITITVPDYIRVEISGTPIFGECKDQTRKKSAVDNLLPILRINHLTLFGSTNIKD